MSDCKRICRHNVRETVLYFAPGKIQPKRLQILRECARRNAFAVTDTFCHEVTHILTELDTREMLVKTLKIDTADYVGAPMMNVEILNTKWLSDSVKRGKPIDGAELSDYRLKGQMTESLDGPVVETNAKYACQRRTLLQYKNAKYVDALDVLALQAEYRDMQHDYSRNLAFCKAIAALKSLPVEVTSSEQIETMMDIGEHSLRVIKEIMDCGKCQEVEDILQSDWFKTMNIFCGVYGIGSSTAQSFFDLNLRTIDDLKKHCLSSRENERILYGLAFYDDLKIPLEIWEAEKIRRILISAAEDCLPGVTVTLTGGFRRGKKTGHDADFLLSHPTEGQEDGLLSNLCERLHSLGYMLHKKSYANSFKKQNLATKMLRCGFKNTMDDFEKAFIIFKLPLQETSVASCKTSSFNKPSMDALCQVATHDRDWKAVRVDLIVVPASQFAYALVGWTGNKHFNRSLRHYAKKELNARLTSHGLWDIAKKSLIPATNEKEVFSNLKLDYLEPFERNP